ncbi:RDD family protein [Methylotenera sp.]|uniref:RDD family protein n=1 Tax=Methylotenera sp. TaxID=2051956 RepID=UPI002730FF15|nr:RDD family protein [Methylotenera sp.]MDP2070225.1 RDD family protein [Methylotenera sp.]MDP3007395.1 RDD family protein [Methylotenera sp.]
MQYQQSSHALAPSFLKLGACLVYEALVIIALLLVSTAVFVLIFGNSASGIKRTLMQLFLFITVGVYFVWCWQKSGQTLAMQTWHLKLVNKEAHLLSLNAAIARYVLACVSLMLFGLGFLWAFLDRDRLFLHDRLLKNRIIYVPRNTTS